MQDPNAPMYPPLDPKLQPNSPSQTNTNPGSPSPESPVKPDTAVKKKSHVFLIILLLLLLIIIIAAVIFGYLYLKSRDKDKTETPPTTEATNDNNEDTDTETPEEEEEEVVPASVRDKIFYNDYYNIFMANKDGTDQVQLTEFGASEGLYVNQIELIDENLIGFFRCEMAVGDYGCKIYQLNILTKAVSVFREFGTTTVLYGLTWVDNNTYAYSADIDPQIKIVYVDNGIENEMSSVARQVTGRGGFIEDDFQLRFSPNNEKLFYINTGGGNGMDFNVYLYDPNGGLLATIQNATKPAWIDNDTIVYRKYSSSSPGFLYMYDLDSRTSTKITESTENAYDPKVLGMNLVFWDRDTQGTSFIYDYANMEINTISDLAIFPLWLSQDEVIIEKTRACSAGECDMPDSLEYELNLVTDSYAVHNLDTDAETVINIDNSYLQNGIITWYNRHV